MTAHDHAEYVEGCFRCDLSRDEVVQQMTPEERHAIRVTMGYVRQTNPWPSVLRVVEQIEAEAAEPCHCGEPVAFGYDMNPNHHRGMCEHCDSVRCDAYPGECGR